MKKTFTFICLLMVIAIAHIHAQGNNQEFIQGKILRFEKMKTTGTVMTLVGTAATVGGIIIMSDADWNQTSDGYETHDSEGFAGGIIATLGVGLMAGGITCWIIGDKKLKKYKKALNELSLSPIVTPNRAGVLLTFRF